MNQTWIHKVLLGAVAVALTGTVLSQSLVNPVRVTIVAQDGATPEHSKKATVVGAAEKKTEFLEISLQNVTPNAIDGATVHYYIFARKSSEKDKSITIAEKGEQTVSLLPTGSLTVTSSIASVTFTPAHETTAKAGSAGKERSTPVKASGERFIGYGAQVELNGTLIGQFFDPLDMTNHLDALVDGANKKNKKAPARKKS